MCSGCVTQNLLDARPARRARIDQIVVPPGAQDWQIRRCKRAGTAGNIVGPIRPCLVAWPGPFVTMSVDCRASA